MKSHIKAVHRDGGFLDQGSNCMRGVEYVGKRKIEIIRPQLANRKPAGAGRG